MKTETIYICPECGKKLEQGEYYYDTERDAMFVERCPECGCGGTKCNTEEIQVKEQVNFQVNDPVYVNGNPEFGKCTVVTLYNGFNNEPKAVVRDWHNLDHCVPTSRIIPADKVAIVLVQDWVDDGTESERKVVIVSNDMDKVKARMQELVEQELQFQKNEERDWVKDYCETTFQTYPEGDYPTSHYDLSIHIAEME